MNVLYVENGAIKTNGFDKITSKGFKLVFINDSIVIFPEIESYVTGEVYNSFNDERLLDLLNSIDFSYATFIWSGNAYIQNYLESRFSLNELLNNE